MRSFLPSCAVLLTTLVCALPWGISDATGPTVSLSAAFPIVVIFACALWWPKRLPSLVTFLAGLLSDAVTGGPLGYWALLYLLALTAAGASHAAIRTPGVLTAWIAFAMTAVLLSVVAWLVSSLYRMEFAAWWPVAWPFAVMALAYPLIAAVLAVLARWMQRRRALGDVTSE